MHRLARKSMLDKPSDFIRNHQKLTKHVVSQKHATPIEYLSFPEVLFWALLKGLFGIILF